ncbi:MAG: hypothetical protein P1V20_10560 [Verrucomicrobiales bacterium]|nr:hypothetical protein [Verrucomicrobiales bacterium]
MTITGQPAVHHSDPFIGLGPERIDFEISAHKRYDEKRRPVKKSKDGRRKETAATPLRIKSKSRISDFQ